MNFHRFTVGLAFMLMACTPSLPQPTATPLVPTTTAPPTATIPSTSTRIPPSATPLPPTATSSPTATATPRIGEWPAEAAQAVIAERAAAVVKALQNQDMRQLASLVHPAIGVRFTPYVYVSPTDLVWQASEISEAWTNPKKYVWGAYDGRGDPIELTFRDYVERFVYDRDYVTAPEVGYNQTNIKGSNIIDNRLEIYPDGLMVEYHFPQSDNPNTGFDWRALRLIFQQAGDEWYLVGVIHVEWTI